MAVYYSIKCPHCKNTVEQGKGSSKHYGSPLRTCPRCKETYINKNYTEPGLLIEDDFQVPVLNYLSSVLMVLIGALMTYYGVSEPYALILIIGLVLIAFGISVLVKSIKYDPSLDEELQREIRESNERLSNPYYVITLWKAGYKIPLLILEWAKRSTGEEYK